MIAEVISIGDELTSGQRLDTNSQWLSQRLGDLGVRVGYHSTVGDDLAANVQVFRTAAERVEVVVTTGGLGPTADDLTRQAMAEAANVPLVTDDNALQQIRALFARRQRPMPERNVVQALIPAGSDVVPNPHGTAPGIYQRVQREDGSMCHLFALPGVPAEMREMWDATVTKILIELLGPARKFIRHKTVKCFGVGESDLEAMLPDVVRRGRTPSVGITVSQATITLRVTGEAPNESDCHRLIEPTLQTIHACLGDLVFGSGDEELQHAVVRLLSESRQTLATAEWGSNGMLSDWLGESDLTRVAFLGGMVLRDGQFPPFLAATLDDSNETPVAAAAQYVRNAFGSDFGLAVGPFPAEPGEDKEGRVELAVATPEGALRQDVSFSGHPAILKARCAKQALNLLRLHLLGGGGEG